MNELDAPFASLDPPPGGRERLRARIERERRARRRRRIAAPALAAAAALAAVVWWLPSGPGPALPGVEASPLGVRLGLAAPPAEPVTIPRDRRAALAARRVDLGTDRVVLYLVGGITTESPVDGRDPALDRS